MTTTAQRAAKAVSRGRRRWIPAFFAMALVGGGIHLILFLFISVPLVESPQDVLEDPFVGYSEKQGDDHRLFQEQAVLLDSKPLFMPTVWNVASSLQDIARLRDEAELFARYPPLLRLRAENWAPGTHAMPPMRTSIEAVLRRHHAFPLRGFGQVQDPASHAPLGSRVAAVSFKNLSGGAAPADFDLYELPGGTAPNRLWTPASFQLVEDARSSGGRPLRVVGSGIPEWDAAIARYLASEAFRQRLAPGYYQVTVGP